MLSEIIKNKLQEKNLSLESLQKQTNIPLKYLVNLTVGNFSDLPALVFIRGYLKKISHTLELNENDLWQEFKNDSEILHASIADRLPKNRFEQALKNRGVLSKALKLIPIIIIAIILLGFLFFQINSLLGSPKIKLETPNEGMVVSEPVITISGYGPGNSYITINGKNVYLEKDGYFSQNIELNPGLNEIVVKAQNKLKRTSLITRHIIFQLEQN